MSKYYKCRRVKILSNNKELKLYIFKPVKNAQEKEKTPGILWIHGGGYITGMAKMIYMSRAINLVKKYGAVVVTPEYTLSLKAPYPAALIDCYNALLYLKDHSEELNFNSSKIMVGGESAGGGLTASLCMYALDKKEVNIAFQMPLYPMIDCYDTESSKDNHAPIWNSKKNRYCWKKYLGDMYDKEVSPYASASRRLDYKGLPPAYTFVGDIEPFYNETLTFIDNLNKAGVEAKVDVYENCFHAFDMLLPHKKISKIAIKKFEEEFLLALDKYEAKQFNKE